jgi:hypothetical protein
MAHNFDQKSCVICKHGFDNDHSVTVYKKGLLTLITYSEIHGKLDLSAYLKQCMSKTPISSVLVHQTCRRDFTDMKRTRKNSVDYESPSTKRLRSTMPSFKWKEDCMLCGKSAAIDVRHPNQSSAVHKVTTIPIRKSLLDCCERRGDSWGVEVQSRLLGCIDLVAAEAVYHNTCFSRFMLNKAPKANLTNNHGRHVDQGMHVAFEKVCTWLECDGDAELYTLAELHAKMSELSKESDVYSLKRLKQKLEERYGQFVFFAEVEGRGTVVCFRNMANYIIEKSFFKQKVDTNDVEQIVL